MCSFIDWKRQFGSRLKCVSECVCLEMDWWLQHTLQKSIFDIFWRVCPVFNEHLHRFSEQSVFLAELQSKHGR